MRTTVDIDTDLLERLRREALGRRVSFKDLLNRLLRDGLERRAARHASYRCPTFSLGTIALKHPHKFLAAAAELEDDAAIWKLERPRP